MQRFPTKELADYLDDGLVLVVEPTVNYRASIKQFLTNLKVPKMKIVANVEEARREMLTAKVAFFIVEWKLDGKNGLQFCRDLRQEAAHRNTPFLLLSVENLRKDVILASEVFIDGYLLKPFSYEDFCSQMLNILRNHTRPNPLNTALDQGEAALEKGDLDQAMELFEKAIHLNPGSARAFCGQAQIHAQRDAHDEAKRLLNKALEKNPEYIHSYKLMLDIGEKTGDRSAMIRAASTLNEMSPDNPKYTLVLARAYMEMGHLDGSEKFFRKTISLSPRLAEAYKGLGNVHMMKDEYERAMKNFQKALDLDREDIGTLNSLGTSYVRLGRYDEGIQRYLMALKMDSHNTSVLFNVGHAYEKKKAYDKAKWYYSQALVYNPQMDKAKRGLARVDKATASFFADDSSQDAS